MYCICLLLTVLLIISLNEKQISHSDSYYTNTNAGKVLMEREKNFNQHLLTLVFVRYIVISALARPHLYHTKEADKLYSDMFNSMFNET